MPPQQRQKTAANILARICEAYGRMLLLKGLFQVCSCIRLHLQPAEMWCPPMVMPHYRLLPRSAVKVLAPSCV